MSTSCVPETVLTQCYSHLGADGRHRGRCQRHMGRTLPCVGCRLQAARHQTAVVGDAILHRMPGAKALDIEPDGCLSAFERHKHDGIKATWHAPG